MKQLLFLYVFSCGFFNQCDNNSTTINRNIIKDQFSGTTKNWNITISFSGDVVLNNTSRFGSNSWSYFSNGPGGIMFVLNLESDAIIVAEMSQLEFCKQKLSIRKKAFSAAYPCGNEFKQEIISVSNMPMVLTESYCKETGDIKYELYTLFDHSELTMVIAYYGGVKDKSDFEKYRDEIKLVCKSINIE